MSVWVYGAPGSFNYFKTNPLRADRQGLKEHIFLVWLVVVIREKISDTLRLLTVRCPHWLVYAISYPLAWIGKIPLIKYLTFSVHPLWRVRVQENFDWLSPPYQSHHTKEELIGWFEENGFDVLKVLPHGFVPQARRFGEEKIMHCRLRFPALLVLGTLLFRPAFAAEPGSFHADGNKHKQAVALTFDDGPGIYTRQILDILDQYHVKATFFMNGDQAAIRPQIAQEVLKRGHEIGDHTYSHVNFYAYEKKNGLEKTKEKIRDEIRKSKSIIEKTTGISLQICRMPNGYNRSWLGAVAKEFNYVLVNWTFGEDWTNVSEQKMSQDYIAHLRPGSILLMHDGGKNRKKTVDDLPKIIQAAKDKNLSFLTISEIIN